MKQAGGGAAYGMQPFGMLSKMGMYGGIEIGEDKRENALFTISFKPRDNCSIHQKVHEFYTKKEEEERERERKS